MVTDDKTPEARGGEGTVPEGAPGVTPAADDAATQQTDPAQQAYTQGQSYAQSAYAQGTPNQTGDQAASTPPAFTPPSYPQPQPPAEQPLGRAAGQPEPQPSAPFGQNGYPQATYPGQNGQAPQNPQAQQSPQAPQTPQPPAGAPQGTGPVAPGGMQGYAPPAYGQGAYGQPANQAGAPTAAYPQAGYGGGVPPFGGAPAPARNPGNKKKIILISSIAGAVVLLLIIGAVVINVVNGSVYGPQATVQSYLQALAQGKAGEANRMVGLGADDEQSALLTDEVFGEASEFIKNPKVSEVVTMGDSASAQVTYSLDGTTYDGYITLSQNGKQGLFFDKWKIDEPLVSPLSVFINQGTHATVNGVDVDFGEEYSLDAYPATYEVGAPDNAFFGADPQTIVVGTGTKASYEGAELNLAPTEALTEEVQKQVDAHLDECAASTSDDPEGCNFYIPWYLDFVDTTSVAYTVVTYPTVTVDESGSYFDTEGGEVQGVVTGTPYTEGDPTSVTYVTDPDWSGFSGDLTVDGDEVTLEFY